MKCNRNVLSDAVRVCLAIGAMGAVAAPAVAQDEATLDRIEVTGSRIKRAEVEGPSPVTVITRQDLDVAGELSISDFLRNNVYNSFGSTREASGSATGSQATISLRGLGAAYTLVLLDGRRMTKSTALNGGSANINLIPTAAVERIEILREGAGAVYGSDAIGGVINIILRVRRGGGEAEQTDGTRRESVSYRFAKQVTVEIHSLSPTSECLAQFGTKIFGPNPWICRQTGRTAWPPLIQQCRMVATNI